MDDLINRQAAIDVIEKWLECSDYNEAERHIMRATESILYDLPSVNQQEPCEDAISRQALLDAFGFSEKTRKWGGDHSGYNTMMLYEIQDMIESAPPVNPQKPKWISVSERLPEKNVWVLVTVVQGSGLYIEIMRIDKYKGMFTDNIDYYDSVIAWMPLPQPYKEESEDKE